MKKSIAYSYYFIILLVMALWDGMETELPMPLRLIFLAATFAPLLKWRVLFPAVFVSTVTIAFTAFTSPLLPTSIYYYIIILLVFAFLSASRQLVLPSVVTILLLIYMVLVDLITQSHIAYPTTRIFMCILAFIIVKGNGDDCIEHMPYAFMMIAIVLSYWVLLRPEARLETMHSLEGYEDSSGWTDPNYLGCMIALGATVATNVLLNSAKSFGRFLFGLLTLTISVFALAYLASRGAILTLFVGLLAFVVLSSKKKIYTKVLFVVVSAAVLIVMYRFNYFDLIVARFQSESIATGTSRTIIWAKKTEAFFKESNLLHLLFGYGQDAALMLGGFGRARAFHNDFIAVLVEYGFVGLSLFLYFLLIAIKRSPLKYKSTVCALMLALFIVCMTLEPILSNMPSSLIFTFFLFYILMYSKTKPSEQ